MKKFLGFFTLALLLSANSFANPVKHNATVEPRNVKKVVEKKVVITNSENGSTFAVIGAVLEDEIAIKKSAASIIKSDLEAEKDAKKSEAKQNLQDAASKIENY